MKMMMMKVMMRGSSHIHHCCSLLTLCFEVDVGHLRVAGEDRVPAGIHHVVQHQSSFLLATDQAGQGSDRYHRR